MQLNLRITYSICSERVDAPKYFTAQGASHCNFVLVKIIYEHIILFYILVYSLWSTMWPFHYIRSPLSWWIWDAGSKITRGSVSFTSLWYMHCSTILRTAFRVIFLPSSFLSSILAYCLPCLQFVKTQVE